jgi:hypothetical protein
MEAEGHPARIHASEAAEEVAEESLGESRWPPVAVILVFLAINIAVRVWLPGRGAIRVPWLLPTVEGILLVVLLTSDPTTLGERRRLHVTALIMASVLVAAALWATVLLVSDLIRGTGVTNSPDQLLASGAVVWLGNNLAFALLYWLMDGGGPLSRSRHSGPVDFAFTQHLSPDIAPPSRCSYTPPSRSHCSDSLSREPSMCSNRHGLVEHGAHPERRR